ncbi:MAG TPA: hypothetical protein DCY18_13345 [Thauera sp.]|uniref:DUF4276 family protein n=1 Tax=Thauera sp. WB-2 TaxID=2897772 RepID=UPI000E8AD266|nr:DUF4276 family protein [Thauera sp. WB-2]HAG76203.1 hypothetical protein [Thauera sp.]WBL64346.1 DUF4276 family protein [Thauera sp. WB-2]HAY10895.1 hypothetical protein [Thauera sp.]HRJ24485.1 DUF4276 family protein [Thauera sp.]HRK10181.1 DUF4276 family protein [Thauera sp.]
MHYLGLALYAEGPTDYYFLRPLLLRLCEDICLNEANQSVEFGEEVVSLDDPARIKGGSRDERIVEAAREARGAWRIVFIHTDGAGSAERARATCAQPAIDRLAQELPNDGVGVAVVPIRETESWALADGDAIRRVFGTLLSDDALGLPHNAAGVEAILDPKKALDDAFLKTNPTSRKRRQGASPMLNALGESVSLQRLRLLPGFQALEHELRRGLEALGILS